MKIDSTLFNITFINNVLFYDTIDSTNNKAKELARRGSVDGSLVIAKAQTAGKGRLGRRFYSDDEGGLYFSIMLRPKVDAVHLSSITLVVALAVSKAINSFCNIKTSIKWPNDIYLNSKKIAGILTEAGPDYVVVGIGVNVNTHQFKTDIHNTATSIYLETHKKYSKADLLYEILLQFNSLYDLFLENKDVSFMTDEYNESLEVLNKDIYLIPQSSSLNTTKPQDIDTSNLESVLCLGINSNGDLICRDKQSCLHYVNSGEISLRAL